MSDSPERIGSFRILGVMGRGGMGVVYRGVHERTGRQAAIKTVRDPRGEIVQSLRREIHTLSRMRHPGIVRVLDSGFENGAPWYAMELLDGITLRQQLRERGSGQALQSTRSGTVSPRSRSRSVPSSQSEHAGDGTEWWTLNLGNRREDQGDTRQVSRSMPANATQ